jgi:hypothetical protein
MDDSSDRSIEFRSLLERAAANSGPEGWDAPGMDVYDGPEYDDVPSDS